MKPQTSLRRKMSFVLPCACALFALCIAIPVSAQMAAPNAGAVVTIHVQDGNGGPVDVQAMVHMTGVDTLTNLVQPTREGIATFTGVIGSEFTIEVSAPGYDTVHEDITISGRMGTNDNFVELRRHRDGLDSKNNRPAIPLLTGKTRDEVEAAVQALRADDPQKAAPHVEFALKHAPADPNVQYYAGVYAQKMKNLPEAKQHFETAIAIYPDHFGAQLDLGSLLLQSQNDPTGAIPHLERAITIQPDSAIAHWLIAEAYLRVHDPANAKSHAARAVDLGKEKSAGAAVTLARAQAMSGDRATGRKTLEEFVRKYPQDPNVAQAQALLNTPGFAPAAADSGHTNN